MLNPLNQSNSIKEVLKPYLKGWFHRLTGITPLGNILNTNYLHSQILLRFMKDLGESQGKGCILDVGCGTKPYKNLFEKPGSLYIGLELSVEVKKDTRYEEPEIIADAGSLPLKNDSVDLVLINEVLEHVSHPGNVLREACRVAKGDGRVVVSMPFMYPEHADPFDYRRLTPEGLSNLVKLEGISLEVHEEAISRISPCGLAPPKNGSSFFSSGPTSHAVTMARHSVPA